MSGTRGTLVNLGCGSTPHPAFVNIDIDPHEGAIAHDLRQGIPLPDSSADLIYHATMLAFLQPEEARRLMDECRRVLRPGGILRIATEDLEQMCRVYLEKLEAAWNGDDAGAFDHEWMLLELYDSVGCERPGGRILDYLRQPSVPNAAFIESRLGDQGRAILAGARRSLVADPPRPGLGERTRRMVKEKVLSTLFRPRAAEAFEIGRFRTSGHVARRMYDRLSVRALFRGAGFVDVACRTSTSSACPAWAEVNLDITASGAPARPHVLIMEGAKPQSQGRVHLPDAALEE
jgi:SAM-dependent methyltransferase